VYAGKNGLAPDLVAALILQESGGNPQAYSRDGAVGLMQVMPSDGLAASFQCPAGPCFARRPSMSQLFDPEFNISFGTSMLAGLIQKFDSIRDGLKYYGPSGIGYDYADKVMAIWDNYQ
jgi:soluble lytic murein transglycosylase-like protein